MSYVIVWGKKIYVSTIVRFFKENFEDEIRSGLSFSEEFQDKLIDVFYAALCQVIDDNAEKLDRNSCYFLKEFSAEIEPRVGFLEINPEDLTGEDMEGSWMPERIETAIVQILEYFNISPSFLSPLQRGDIERMVSEETGCEITLL